MFFLTAIEGSVMLRFEARKSIFFLGDFKGRTTRMFVLLSLLCDSVGDHFSRLPLHLMVHQEQLNPPPALLFTKMFFFFS
jgi:hypothetical protein